MNDIILNLLNIIQIILISTHNDILINIGKERLTEKQWQWQWSKGEGVGGQRVVLQSVSYAVWGKFHVGYVTACGW